MPLTAQRRYGDGVNLNPVQKFKVALNPLHRTFLNFANNYILHNAYYNSIIKVGGYQTHAAWTYKYLKLKLRVFLADHIVAIFSYYVA